MLSQEQLILSVVVVEVVVKAEVLVVVLSQVEVKADMEQMEVTELRIQEAVVVELVVAVLSAEEQVVQAS